MEHFAESRFWRAVAVALVAGIFALASSIAAEREVRFLPVAEAGGVYGGSGAVFTTSESGATLYVWPVGQAGAATTSYFVEEWTADGRILRRPLRRVDVPIPAEPPRGDVPGGRYGDAPR